MFVWLCQSVLSPDYNPFQLIKRKMHFCFGLALLLVLLSVAKIDNSALTAHLTALSARHFILTYYLKQLPTNKNLKHIYNLQQINMRETGKVNSYFLQQNYTSFRMISIQFLAAAKASCVHLFWGLIMFFQLHNYTITWGLIR